MSDTVPVAASAAGDPVESAKDIAQDAYALVRERRQAALAQRLLQSASLMTGRAEVVAVGTRSVGKSSLLNALLDRKDLLPVDMDVSSNVYVRVGYGPVADGAKDPGEHLRVELTGEQKPVEAPLEDLALWASESGNPNNDKGVSHVRVRLASALTEDGILLTDTPGAGGLVAAHGAVVRSACRRANGLLVALDHVQPISETVLGFLASLGDDTPRVVFAFNKTDVPGDTARSIADTRELLVGAGLPDLAQAPMIGTSAFLYQEAHELGEEGIPDELMLEDSGIPALREALAAGILEPTRRDQARALSGDISDVLETLAAPDTGLLRQADGGSAVTDEAVAELRRLQKLDIKRELQTRLDAMLEDADADLRDAITRQTQRIEDDLDANFSPGLRESLPARIDEEVRAAWLDVSDAMRASIIAKAEEVIVGIELALPETGLPGYEPGELPPDGRRTEGRWRRLGGKLGRAIVMPWTIPSLIFDHSAERRQQKVGLSRSSAIKYVGRERNRALATAPRQLKRDYRAHVRQALDELASTRAVRLEALRSVRDAVENPPTPERVAAAEQRLAALRPLEERIRDLAARL